MAKKIVISWRHLFTQTIRSRGMSVYRSGKVGELQRTGTTFQTKVVGSHHRIYDVSVTLSRDLTGVERMSCTCPYAADGTACKHEAALFYRIEAENLVEEAAAPQRGRRSAKKEYTAEQLGGEGYAVRAGRVVYEPHRQEEAPVQEQIAESAKEPEGAWNVIGQDGSAIFEEDQPPMQEEPQDEAGAVQEVLELPEQEQGDHSFGIASLASYRYFDYGTIMETMHFTPTNWVKGVELARSGKVQLTSLEFTPARVIRDRGAEMENIGVVWGNVRNRYGWNDSLHLVLTRDGVVDAECGAMGCRVDRYNPIQSPEVNPCVHLAALIWLLREPLDERGEELDATDAGGSALMQEMAHRQALVRRGEDGAAQGTQKLELSPLLERENGELRVSFRIGAGRLYKIKDLQDFARGMERSETRAFGRKTVLTLGSEYLDRRSQEIWSFLRENVAEERVIGERLTGLENPGAVDTLLLYGRRLDDFYALMKDREFDSRYRGSTGSWVPERLRTAEQPPKITAKLSVVKDQGEIFHGVEVQGKMPVLHEGKEGAFFVQDGVLDRISLERAKELAPLTRTQSGGKFFFTIGRNSLTDFYYGALPWLREHAQVSGDDDPQITRYLLPQTELTFYLDIEDGVASCRVLASYGKIRRDLSLESEEDESQGAQELFRNRSREREAVALVRQYFPQVDEQQHAFVMDGEEDRLFELLSHGIDELLGQGEVRSSNSFLRLRIRRKPKIQVGVSLESDLVDLKIGSPDMSEEELLELLASYRSHKKFYRLRSGDFIRLEDDEAVQTLSEMFDTLHVSPKEFVEGKMQLPAYRALYIQKMLEGQEEIYETRDAHFRHLIHEFRSVEDADFALPQGISGKLRGYQEEGYRWMRTLETYGFGGILADEMGLGKTLQVIALLEAAKERAQEQQKEQGTEARIQALIVTPASLVYNWEEEFHRFAPLLAVQPVTGTRGERRAIIGGHAEVDVLITSYDLLKRDLADYDGIHFDYEVLDEAQYIKNHTSQAAKSVKIIDSAHRFALTGTPIENRLSELWSIFDFLMPGFLYAYENFRAEFEMAIMRDQDDAVMEQLRRMVTPFILRRLKKDVLRDLPEKIEEVYYTQMEKDQRRLYDAQVLHMKNILENTSGEEFGRRRIQILAELMKIRQICCDPQLLFDGYHGSSAKLEACMELVHRVIEGGHRALIFSQFTSMLELIQKALEAEKIEYYEITGQTPKQKRVELVRSFNEGTVPVFLISLRAGGTGLNLTGADVVIHYDPWWNTAAQDQATGRAHRIGQTHLVTVYRLITRATIEEKILKMQESKRALADGILGSPEISSGTISREDLLELLE